jgi:hypothetical protein
MVSSPGFGFLPPSLLEKFEKRTINTWFPFASAPKHLDKESGGARWLVLQKARGHPAKAGLPLFVGIWFQVLFHRPYRATFHLSLTVLVRYR